MKLQYFQVCIAIFERLSFQNFCILNNICLHCISYTTKAVQEKKKTDFNTTQYNENQIEARAMLGPAPTASRKEKKMEDPMTKPTLKQRDY